MYSIEYRGETNLQHGIYITKRPAVPAAVEEVKTYKVAGRDGILTGDRYLRPLSLKVEMNFKAAPDMWADKFREIKAWLSESGRLIQSDDPDWFFKVLYVQVQNEERKIKRLGKFNVVFTCDPYMYRIDGTIPYAIDAARITYNEYEECHPSYILTGSGTRGLTVNGNQVTIEVNGTTIVDTDRMITYTQNDLKLRNTRLSGDYEDLYLKKGENTISGDDVTIIPNWRSR